MTWQDRMKAACETTDVNPHAHCVVSAQEDGGQLMEELLAGIVGPRVCNPTLSLLDDSAVVDVPASKLTLTGNDHHPTSTLQT